PLEYKANALGYFDQIQKCGRVIDAERGQINMDDIFECLYFIKRNRAAGGASIDTIDCFTNRWVANDILKGMMAYYKAEYGVTPTYNIEMNKTLDFGGIIKFNHNIYEIPKLG